MFRLIAEQENSADLFAFSAMTNTFQYVRQYDRWAKETFSVPILSGGLHTTLNPEDVINLPYIDYICIGEGEESIAEFCEAWERGEEWVNEKAHARCERNVEMSSGLEIRQLVAGPSLDH